MKKWIFDISSFFFPLYCPVCNTPMHVPGQVMCLGCERGMPKTTYANDPDNPVAQIFWGRIRLMGATSLFRFEKGSKYQNLLHLLKYKGDQGIGEFLGKMLGAELISSPFNQVDMVVPVPLHPKKEKKRGYNQSEIIARGFSQVTGIPVRNDLVYRNIHTPSQTNKNRFERWENMENVFSINKEADLPSDPKILVVDDVITTGATLEACAASLLTLSGARLYIATIACA